MTLGWSGGEKKTKELVKPQNLTTENKNSRFDARRRHAKNSKPRDDTRRTSSAKISEGKN